MKHVVLLITLLCACVAPMSAQLTLQQIAGKRQTTLSAGTTITLVRPTSTSDESCECFHAFTGKLINVQNNDALLLLKDENRIYMDDFGVARNIKTEYAYPKQEVPTPVPLDDLLYVAKRMPLRKKLDGVGGTLIFVAAFHGLVTAPLLSAKARKTSDQVVWAMLGVGVTLAALPNQKTYHFRQPKDKQKPLWQLKMR